MNPTERLDVRKTYKLFIGGQFPRSESGRSYQVTGKNGVFLANAAMASRKDARDAVRVARSAYSSWSNATAYNRGQVLYRIAEMTEARKSQFIDEISASELCSASAAKKQVEAAIDRWVWYAGWSDKFWSVAGSANPVAGPYFNFSTPEPVGVSAIVAPQDSSLLGLVSVIAPAMVVGCAVVVIASQTRPLSAVTLGEVLATSDLPPGVLNVLTGDQSEITPWLASHGDVNALDLTGIKNEALATELTKQAAGTIKRVLPRGTKSIDWYQDQGLERMRFFTEARTVWHPVGA